ncbi:MAG: homocysteine S-methyltransferase family protein [Eubacterium sp.]
MNFEELLQQNFIILDGAMGTMLQRRGLKQGGVPEVLNITNPLEITDIHKEYIEAGAQIIYANTFGANAYKLEHTGYSVKEIVGAAIDNAVNASNGRALVALDMGPIGQLMEPSGTMTFDDAYNMFAEMIIAADKADIIVIETMTDLLETKAALLAAKENSHKPVICTMTFEDSGRTFTGCKVSSMALTLEGLGADAIGINCSLGPKDLEPILEELAKWTNLPIVAKPNAGLPDPLTNEYNLTPEDFSVLMAELANIGVKIFGGCCGTTPDYIKLLKYELEKLEPGIYKREKISIPAAVCSASTTVTINAPRIIGERINPTGKKKFKEALKNNDIDYIMSQAIEQVNGGADILDVNVGLPDIDEKDMMLKTIKALQGITAVPLQIDSTMPEVLDSALRTYCGKPIVNSVNGEEKSLKTVLPLVKKYGAAVVGLTLDENGIPKKAEDRVRIAERILENALAIGIPKENIFIDCLTLTVSAEQEGAQETLKALQTVKNKLGLKTVLGVSNISFGLPNRELVNRTFLTMALNCGLDLPIINPNIASMTGAVRAYKVLASYDKNSAEYIGAYSGVENNIPAATHSTEKVSDISQAVERGLKQEAANIASELLKSNEAMDIINKMLIPTLDVIGEKFEKGIIFLPQLMLSAEAAKAAFEQIKKAMPASEDGGKGKIILATVKGDIHDIGKNIVKVILENYGYDVIDLGKDVDCKLVADAAQKYDVKLVGLSALMTTTLSSMEETIRLIRQSGHECKIMVGGAVLTNDYAMKIGADYYSKDAKQSADVAKLVLG